MSSTYTNPDKPMNTGVPRDPAVESDPRNTNRAHKVAPMPEVCGRSLKDGAMSGGGSHGPTRDGSGKGGDPPGRAGKERRAKKEAHHLDKREPGS